MANVNQVVGEVSERVGDIELERITKEQLLVLINAAARDLLGAGIVIGLTDNESLTSSSGALSIVPASFAYIHDIWGGTSFRTWIPQSHWSFQVVSSAPNILWDSELLATSSTVQLNGHARPNAAYALGSTSIDTGMEAFVRERASAYAAKQLAQVAEGTPAANLEGISNSAMAESTVLLQLLGAQAHFRPHRYSRAVPLR